MLFENPASLWLTEHCKKALRNKTISQKRQASHRSADETPTSAVVIDTINARRTGRKENHKPSGQAKKTYKVLLISARKNEIYNVT